MWLLFCQKKLRRPRNKRIKTSKGIGISGRQPTNGRKSHEKQPSRSFIHLYCEKLTYTKTLKVRWTLRLQKLESMQWKYQCHDRAKLAKMMHAFQHHSLLAFGALMSWKSQIIRGTYSMGTKAAGISKK